MQEPKIATSNKTLSQTQRDKFFHHMLVNDNYKCSYCYVPKIGCTNWKKVLKVLSEQDAWPGCRPFSHIADVVRLSKFSKEERLRRLKTYYKFMFVRDPLDRLVSAYLDKFHPSGSDMVLRKKYAPIIVRKYRRPPLSKEQVEKARGDDVTFPEFANT
ncbi:carbohydrate sulfotransferase 14-like [Sycon ciliatum]|uniref:carbohydrate sulfotransferase 14-like n=1 Tax=Sycon ciliatum TaxID=27933 RepID=UPI0031F6E24E